MERVFPETRRMVKVTAPQIAARNSLKFPRKETKFSLINRSDSVVVGSGEFSKSASISPATRDASSGL